MGRRVADPTNPVPALGVPLAGGQWGPLCSVGVQTSPGLRTIPSLKRNNSQPTSTQHPETTATCDLSGSFHTSKEMSQNTINSLTQEDLGSQGGVYCQVKAVRTNDRESGSRANGKRMSRYTNGSVVAPEVVGGVCSEGSEGNEQIREKRRVQSLKGEGSRPVLRSGNTCVNAHATLPRPCRMMTTSRPRLCGTCGRRQSQVPAICMAPACRRRAANQITASQTLPNPIRKQSTAKPPPPVLHIGSQATPPLPPHSPRTVEVAPRPAPPILQTNPTPTKVPAPLVKSEDSKTPPPTLAKEAQVPHTAPQCNGAPGGLLHGRLQSVEESLLSNQEKIKVLLNVIQDLEKSKALSEGVEHDFRQQEGRLQGVMEALEGGDHDVPLPLPKAGSSSSSSRPNTKSRVKKLRKKCFWWL
ncbi:LOW QUALITY PROTEIN: uncharacterized protein [Osmerus mordax]|uniref:LOW QUALITY PROTEIN: uncharacterized protein n=1 Tax=Osmerus mordax TaxID=8014 RepID=UPI00351061CC